MDDNGGLRDWRAGRESAFEVFRVFLLLGLTSFGGPVAHLGYFRDAFVVRRAWLTDRAYADLVAMCQFLPGPASSQVGMAIGLHRAGYLGMAAAWVAFTLPSAVLMVGFAYGMSNLGSAIDAGWLLGLKAAAVAVVAHAVFGMATSLATGRRRATIAVAAMVVVLLLPTAGGQMLAIVLGGLAGLFLLAQTDASGEATQSASLRTPGTRVGAASLGAFVVLLLGLPAAATLASAPTLTLLDIFYRAGALVFGGGHVVLPLLQADLVEAGLVDQQSFLAGYGAAQAVPGPMFTFAAYLGAVMPTAPTGIVGGTVALLAVFAPSALLVLGVLPFWERLRAVPRVQGAVAGASAAVVGLLAAALYDPVFLSGVTSPTTMALAAVAFLALSNWRLPAWVVVIAASAVGFLVL